MMQKLPDCLELLSCHLELLSVDLQNSDSLLFGLALAQGRGHGRTRLRDVELLAVAVKHVLRSQPGINGQDEF